MIKANQEEILDMSFEFLEKEYEMTENEIYNLSEFERYYLMREIIAKWNSKSLNEIYLMNMQLESQGYLNNSYV